MKRNSCFARLIILTLALTLCLCGTVACRDNPPDDPIDGPIDDPIDDPTDGPSEGDTPPEPQWPDDGETVTITNPAEYTVVRGETAESDVRVEASALYSAMRERFNGIKIGTDYTKDPTPVANTAYEILVGETNRVESIEAMSAAAEATGGAEHWYHVGVHGNKIVIVGSDDANTLVAIRYFLARYLAKDQSTLEVPLNMSRSYEKNKLTVISTDANDVFVASADLSGEPYFIDRTGTRDMTAVIQEAINDVAKLGGGVVYLPMGTYRISKQIEIPSYVTLRGDYVDPDSNDYSRATLLLLDQKGSFKSTSAVLVQSSAAVQGLTFYYEKQSVTNPIEYMPTVETKGDVCTVKDCNFINSYYAIFTGTNAKGMLTVDNVKGTALWRGLDNNNSADICVTMNVKFSPCYWAEAGEKFNAPAEADIRALMKSNGSIGMTLGDCDRDTYENVVLDGFFTGIYNREPTRAGLCGSYAYVHILDAKIGLDLHGLNGAYGLLLTNCTIEASDIAVRNVVTTAKETPNVYLLNCEVTGSLSDNVVPMSISSSISEDTDYKMIANRPAVLATKLFNLADYGADATGKTDISAALQKALDEAAAAGGGIVYMPAGIYRLTAPVTVGEKTVIMGAQQNPQRGSDAFRGTVMLVTYGEKGKESDTAAITVNGNNSGITGMTVYYPNNGVSSANTLTESPVEYSYFVRCKGGNTFATNLCLIAASRGVCFDGADGFIADRILMTVFDNGIGVNNAKNGVITRIHTNGTYHNIGIKAQTVLHPDWMTDASRVYELIDTHLSPRMTLVKVNGSEKIQLRHVFHYGANTFLWVAKSDVELINCESGHIARGKSFVLGGEVELWGVNFIRENPYEATEELQMGNVMTIYQFKAAHRASAIHVK